RYATLVETAGYLPVALSARDYIELLPARWQAINAYGIRINHRTYDAEELNPLRRELSGIAGKNNRWEIHHDPYDVSRVWVRDHRNDTWITATWTHLHRAPTPFGELAWDHTRAGLPEATEAELADAVTALLQRAHHGPTDDRGSGRGPSRRDRRVAATTRATNATLTPPAEPATTEPDGDDQPDGDGQLAATEPDAPLATVIPLGIFDPFTEARKRW
ncbi:MAG: Mu transposase C-terminal domain-containing protein, partial [Actinomycetes bacterium]